MSVPAITVELAFGSTYSTPAASRTWTDVTTYVLKPESLDTTVGRQDELSTASPNSVRLVFDNSDGRFTPGKTAGAYYPNVKIGVPVRVKATPSGQAASTRFVGYVDEWPLAWPGVKGSFAVSAIQASSRLARLGLSTKLRSIIEAEYLLDSPAAYYTLGEAAGATSASDISGNKAPKLTQTSDGATAVVFGNATGPSTDGLTAAEFTFLGKWLHAEPLAVPVTAGWVEVAFVTSQNSITLIDAETSGGSAMRLNIAANKLQGLADDNSIAILSSATVNDGLLHHALIASADGGPTTLYLDGVDAGTDATAVTLDTVVALTVGSGDAVTIAHAAFGASAMTSTRAAAHANACLDGFAGETPAARLARYAAFAGIATAEQSLETGETTMAHLDTTGSTVVDMMRKVETTEAGVLFDAPDGDLTFHDRSHRYAAAAAFTFNVASGNVQPDYAPKLDRSALVNLAQVTNADRTVDVVAEDADSRTTYGDHERTIEVASTNTDEPSRRADWEVGIHGEPGTRVPSLTVELGKFTAANQSTILGLDVGDRIDVSNLMTQAPNSTERFFVEGWTEHVGPGEHRLTFNVSPAAPYDVWILGDSTYGVLGSTTRLAF